MITEKKLKKAGYHRHESNGICFPFADYFYQKKFTDAEGIRYFLEFVHYPAKEYGNGGVSHESWKCTMNINSPHMTFEQHGVDDIEKAESLCLCFWRSMHCDYYEKYEEMKG